MLQYAITDIYLNASIHAVSGTCASINHSNSCCPPRQNCQAADGNCHCGADCHALGNCCVDAHCPSRKKFILIVPLNSVIMRHCYSLSNYCFVQGQEPVLIDVGITTCCNDPVNGHCDVFHRSLHNNRYHCSCNATCHDRNDCCSDAVAIGCVRKFSIFEGCMYLIL